VADLSVIIVSHNTRDLLADCLTTLTDSSADLELEIIVVDNASTDGTLEHIREYFPSVHLIANNDNRGFAAANNLGIAAAGSPVVLLLNSDAFVNASVLSECLALIERDARVGMVGVQLLNPDGSVQAEDGKFPSLWTDISISLGLDKLWKRPVQTRAPRVRPADWVQGACLFVRRDAIQDAGSLDESFFMYSEEVDWCHRFWQRGWHVVYNGSVSVIHLGGASSRRNDLGRRIALYRSRLGLRRRMGGSLSCAILWIVMVLGFAARIPVQLLMWSIPGRSNRRHRPEEDWQLLCQILAMDPTAAWAKTD
jgi:N-acetylglucosaminyl-diphospho-decaprenol L-rhamnosyltransferase